MTTNQTIGLISAICLGLVILWDYFRRKKERVIWLKTYNKTPEYYQPEELPFKKGWWPVTDRDIGPIIITKDDVPTHEKVLEDIKKVEANYDSEFVNQVARLPIGPVDLERKDT